MFETIGLIGTGNMGSSVIKAVYKSLPASEYYFANRSIWKAEKLREDLTSGTVCSASEIARTCDVIFLAVKPKDLGELMDEISPILSARADKFMLVSMLAGFTAEDIQESSSTIAPVIFMMPNTPVSVGGGIILYNSVSANESELYAFENAMKYAGTVSRMPQSAIDSYGTMTGCGPAMAYMFIEALADAAVSCGLPRKDAINYAALMLQGSAKMVLESGIHPEQLKDNVCSPGGTTIQMVRRLEEKGFRSAVIEAVLAAYNS